MARFSGVSTGTVPANTNSLVSTTLPKLQRSIVDNFFGATPLFMWLREKGRTIPWEGGDTIEVPLLYQDNQMGAAYESWETTDVRPPRGITTAIYSMAHYRIPVAYTRAMANANRGENAIVNLIQTLKDQAESSLVRVLNTDLYLESGFQAKKMNSMYQIFEETPQASQTKIVGGISKSAYNSWWSHYFRSVATTAGQSGVLAAVRDMYMQAGDQGDFPDLFVCDEYTYVNLEDKLQTAVRFVNPQAVDWGFDNIMYKGMTIMFDKTIADDGHDTDKTDGTGFMINSKYLKLAIGTDGNFRVVPPEYDFKQDAFVGGILVDIQLLTTQMRRHAVLTGAAYASAC